MIAQLRGVLAEKSPDQALIDVGGVGYRVFIPLSTYEALPELEKEVKLVTVTHVREDAFHLFGFSTRRERDFFILLNGVNGIGAKLALAALSALTPETLSTAIAQADVTTLSRISGVGKKTAQRMVMELKDKLPNLTAIPVSGLPSQPGTMLPASMREELISALINLGYKRNQVELVLRQLPMDEMKDVGEGIRTALKLLAR
ncbi:MAG: Holliday junction branch migration protein RuvA [Magnetococcales bacterium]|nr:Holliday junction branch migration protein RuvA [Magnetococcales bacterium]